MLEKKSELILIGMNIRKIREQQKISRLQLAFEIDSTEKHIVRIENGEVNTGVYTLVKLSRSLNVDPCLFFKDVV